MASDSATFRIWRGDAQGGAFQDYTTEVSEGMVVLDAVHQIQAEQANDLAVRWNCKAGKCGSCSAEVNGNPRLMCMTRLNQLDLRSRSRSSRCARFRSIRDLVTDVSWNYEAKKSIKRFKPRPPDAADGTWRMAQVDVERVQEFRKCIECFLCQDVCHVLREHQMFDEFVGPRHLVYAAALEMHPLDTENRARDLKQRARRRLLQHHEVLHQGLPREHHHHRQRDHPAEGARDRSALRSGRQAVPDVPARWSAARVEVAMEFELKTLSPEAVARALAKAERYRLLNEPGEAESICLDALEVEPDNQEALITLLLALTDSSTTTRRRVAEAWTTVARLRDDYERAYYTGIVHERRAKALLRHGTPGCGPQAYEWLREAMSLVRAGRSAFARPATTMRCCGGMRARG